ncbi:unnamed protein product [Cuscuta europaea]|uniref:BHLH domain-containing protein n=1 Tax=Cuscuta europaea TaxID=41803 RepID=A0A9P0ZSM3_CUSEU|nr:unnamed protein product [Cuscuta europaea]
MAAFPTYQSFLDSTSSSSSVVFLEPNSSMYKIPSGNFMGENTHKFSQFYLQSESGQEPSPFLTTDNNITEAAAAASTSASPSSSVTTTRHESGDHVTHQSATPSIMPRKRKSKNHSSSFNSLPSSKNNNNGREGEEGKRQRKGNAVKEGKEKKTKEDKKCTEEAPTGYIHVRARRGQATDSHSLAERVRREKISERMKLLQDLVPGCDKVSGKALMLDEIINYVQSLQNQVEFLSMKLTSVSPMFYDYGMDLDPIMRPDQQDMNIERMNGAMANIQQQVLCNPTAAAVVSDANTVLTAIPPPNCDDFPLLDCSAPRLYHQQTPHALTNPLNLGNGQVLWGGEDHRQKFINENGFSSNNLCSFH